MKIHPDYELEEGDGDAAVSLESAMVVFPLVLVHHVHGPMNTTATETACVAALVGECRS